MLNSTTWLYGAEVLPIALRSKVMGLAAASHFIVNVASKSSFPQRLYHPSNTIIVTEAGPSAFANIHESYYYVFVACSFLFLILAYFYFPWVFRCGLLPRRQGYWLTTSSETKQKTLEEIAAAFGDKVVQLTERDLAAEEVVMDNKTKFEKVEME